MLGGRAHYATKLPPYISHHALASQEMAGGKRGGAWVRQGRGGLAGTVAGGRVGELLLAPLLLLLQPWVASTAAAARHAGRHADALSPHHHSALLVGVLLLLLPLTQVVVEVLALALGQHLGVEVSLYGQEVNRNITHLFSKMYSRLSYIFKTWTVTILYC